MKLVNSKYNLDIEFEENISNTLVLENKQHMIDVIQNLILQLKGDEGDFVLSAEKNVKFDKVVEFIANPFEIDFNNKKIVTKLFEQLIAVASECVEEYNFINGKIVGTLDDICSKIEYYNVEYNLEYEWKSIFKLYNVRIGENYNSLCEKIEEYVRSIPDFPEPGIIFRDVTSVLQDAEGLHLAIDQMQEKLEGVDFDVVLGPESRGFIFGVPIAYNMHKAFVPVRKKGKLPRATISQTYDLEYGTATIEIHKDAIQPGQKVVIIDDLIATGGTTEAIIKMVEELGGEVVKIVFLMELVGLKGRERLSGYDIDSAIIYEGK